MNLWDILLAAAIAAAVGLAVWRIAANRKKGGCGCGCEGCTRACGRRKE